MEDVLYTLGTAKPGAITLRNYPRFLRDLKTPEGLHIDLGAVDILRHRERGVPRYNDFRRQLRLQPVRDWNELAGGNPSLAHLLEAIYEGRIEDVDAMIGMLGEQLPEGFGFSDTAFRIFILMASRPLQSDRFFTSELRPEIYTNIGMEWIRRATMKGNSTSASPSP